MIKSASLGHRKAGSTNFRFSQKNQSGVTEDINIPKNWIYRIEDPSGKNYTLIVLRYGSDGEDPFPKPILIITDGNYFEIKKYKFDEEYSGNRNSDILKLLTKISNEPISKQMQKAMKGIVLDLK